MSRFGQYSEAFNSIGPWEFTKRIYKEINDDGVLTWASALAYSWMLAMFPLFIFLLTTVAFLPLGDKQQTQDQINGYITRSLPPEAAKIITDNVPDIISNQRGGLLTIGALFTLWAASGGMASTMSALNRCYDITEDQAFYIARPKAVLLTLILIVLVLFVVLILPIGGIVLEWIKVHQGGLGVSVFAEVGINLARWTLSVGALFAIVAIAYYFGPRMKGGFRFITPGGAFAVGGWIILGLLFRLYFTSLGGAGSYGKTYGAVGGVIILLLFLYAASALLLIGAEINSEFDFALYGRTGGVAAKPGERPGSATPEAEQAAEFAPKAGNNAPIGPGQQHTPPVAIVPPHGSTPAYPATLTSPAFTNRAGLTPAHYRDKRPAAAGVKKTSHTGQIVLTGSVAAAALITGYLLRRPAKIFTAKLTPRRRLARVYPMTYAVLKRA